MGSYAIQALGGWRNEACAIPITVPGLDLAAVAVRAQIRADADNPVLTLDLPGGVAAGVTGIRTLPTTMDGSGIPTSHLMFQIAKVDMQALPYAGEVGDAWVGAYALQIAGVTRMTGPFAVLASSIDSDGAPANRPAGYGATATASPASSLSLLIGDGGVAVSIYAADLIAPLVAQAKAYGPSPLQQIMLPALALGRMPKTLPANSAGTFVAVSAYDTNSNTPPNGNYPATSYPYTSAGHWTWEGGVLVTNQNQSRINTYSATGNANPALSCVSSRLRMNLSSAQGVGVALLIFDSQPFRIVIDGIYFGGYDNVYTLPQDDMGRVVEIGATNSGASLIEIECLGTLGFIKAWFRNGTTSIAPLARPRICWIGTSVVERNGWTGAAANILGVDGWNTGVGGTGVLNPGTGGRVKLHDRSNDYTQVPFAWAFHEGIINDDQAGLYADQGYATIRNTMRDEYRRNLDTWFAAQPNSPWIASGYAANAAIATICYPIRDGMQQACSEYAGLAAFIDPFKGQGSLFPGTDFTQPPLLDYFDPPDNTHPNEYGALMLGARRAQEIGDLIRGRRF